MFIYDTNFPCGFLNIQYYLFWDDGNGLLNILFQQQCLSIENLIMALGRHNINV